MSGPVSTADAAAEPAADRPEECDLEVLEGRNVEVGSFGVNRVLPRRGRRALLAENIGHRDLGIVIRI